MDDNRAVDKKCEFCNEALVKALLPNSRANRLLEEIHSKTGEKSITKSDISCCASCPEGLNARAYFAAPPATIVLCSEKLHTPLGVEESLVHELVHAYDYLVYESKLENCMEVARSEVRAAREAECHYSYQVTKNKNFTYLPPQRPYLLIGWDYYFGLSLMTTNISPSSSLAVIYGNGAFETPP